MFEQLALREGTDRFGRRRRSSLEARHWFCRLIVPPVLVKEGCRVAPWPIVGLGDVAPETGHDGVEGRALESEAKFPLGIPLADLVREKAPELIEFASRGRNRNGRGSFFFRGFGGRFFFRGNLVGGFRGFRWNSGGKLFCCLAISVISSASIGNRVLYVLYNLYVLR